jgi:hypothetical protein
MQKKHPFLVVSLLLYLCLGNFITAQTEVEDTLRGVLKLPENVSIELISPARGMLMLSEENGQVELPQGHWRLESWTLKRKDENGHIWRLSGDLNSGRMIEVGEEPTTLEIKTEPIACDLKIHPYQNAMNFILSLAGPSGERLRISGDAPGVKSDQLPQPTFVLYNPDRSFEKSHQFQSQCCGNYRFNWTPPADAAGPFFVDINLAGPFKIDFEPVDLSEAHQATIEEQQAWHKKRMRQLYRVGLCYAAATAMLVGGLIKFRKSIAAAMQKDERKLIGKPLILTLFVFVILLILDPLFCLVTGKSSLDDIVFQYGILLALFLAGAVIAWGVRKIQTKWPFVTIMLYGILFVLLLIPIVFMVFTGFGRPETDLNDFHLNDWFEFYAMLFSFSELSVLVVWAVILAIFIAQASLLIVPVRVRHQRPKKRKGILWTAIMAALLYTALLFFAGLAIMAALWGDDFSEPVFFILLGILPLNWIVWSIVFWMMSRSIEPESFIRRLMYWLIGGSILELLIAVPSHIIVRHRDVCCAHGLTAAGLTTGLAVIFFAFGPGLYFLYADRIRSKQADLSESDKKPMIETETPL